MGIAEQNMVGVAAGLATLGYVPWLSSFGVFLTHRAADPVRMLVAQTHANVKIGAAYTGLLTGRTGKTHQDVEDLAIMRAMPGMTVLAPGDATECIAMVRWASAMSGPVYLRLARDAGPDLVDPDYAFIPGRVLLVREGTDVLIVSTGMQTARCIAAAVLLEADGISAGVLHVPSLKPVDARAVAAAAASRAAGRQRRGTLGLRWAGRAGGRDPGRPIAPPASSGSGSRTPGANRPRTRSCSTVTACHPSGSPSASHERSGARACRPMPRWAPRHDHHEPRRRDDHVQRSRTRPASGSPSSAWAGSG